MTVGQMIRALQNFDPDLPMYSYEEAWLVELVAPKVIRAGMKRGDYVELHGDEQPDEFKAVLV